MIVWPKTKPPGKTYVPANTKRGRQIAAQTGSKLQLKPLKPIKQDDDNK
jgi:hypothetical protein